MKNAKEIVKNPHPITGVLHSTPKQSMPERETDTEKLHTELT